MTFLKILFSRKKTKVSNQNYWFTNGSNILDFNRGKAVGFSDIKPIIGDWLFVPMKSGRTIIMEFISVHICGDPPDMFFGDLKPLGYSTDIKFDSNKEKLDLGHVL